MRSTIRLRESVDSKACDSILKVAMFWFVKVFKDFIVELQNIVLTLSTIYPTEKGDSRAF